MALNKNNQQKFEDRRSEITIEELRELDSFANYTDEQAKQLIETMKAFARIVYNISAKEESGTIFANKTVAINISEQLNKAA